MLVFYYFYLVTISLYNSTAFVANKNIKNNVKVHYNFVDSIETFKKFVSRVQCP